MTDDLAEARRHISALLEMSEDLFPGFIPGCGSYLAAEARKDDARREAQAFLDAEGQPVEGGDPAQLTLAEAFDIGYQWRGQLFGQTLEDSRAVGRTLLSDMFTERGLTIDTENWESFANADHGICEGKRRIKAALDAAELTRLKAAQPEHDRTVRLAALEEVRNALCDYCANGVEFTGHWHVWHTGNAADITAGCKAQPIRSLMDQTGGDGGNG